MTDLERAYELLQQGNTCVLCKGSSILQSQKTGIAPMLDFIAAGENMQGFSAADKIIGKAAAMLFALSGVTSVYGEVMSRAALPVLQKYGIRFAFGTLTDYIVNRRGDGLCPMEQTVKELNDLTEAYEALWAKRRELMAGNK